jgi:hypothetical protein
MSPRDKVKLPWSREIKETTAAATFGLEVSPVFEIATGESSSSRLWVWLVRVGCF